MPHNHIILDNDNRFIIDADTRAVSNASDNRITLMQKDHKSERFTFEIPRRIEGHDVLECDLIEIKYQNVGSGTSASLRPVMADKYIVQDISADPEDDDRAIFSWLLEENATWYAGTLSFQIKFACYEDPAAGTYSFKWHTDKFTNIAINAGLDVDGAIEDKYPGILEQFAARIDYLYENIVEHAHPGCLMLNSEQRIIQVGLDLCRGNHTMTVAEDMEGTNFVTFDSNMYIVEENELVGRQVIINDVMYSVRSNTSSRMYLYDPEFPEYRVSITAPAGTVIYPADVDVTDIIKQSDAVSALEQKVDDLLYSQNPFTIKSFTNDVGTVELGSTVEKVTLSWVFSREPETVSVASVEQTPSISGSYEPEDGKGLSLQGPGNRNWVMSATHKKEASAKTAATGVTFANRIWYGAAAERETYDSTFVKGLSKNLLQNKKPSSITVNAGTGEYIYYCQPTRIKTCVFSFGANEGGVSLVDTIDVTNDSGYTEQYYIYRSDNPGLGNTTLGVK